MLALLFAHFLPFSSSMVLGHHSSSHLASLQAASLLMSPAADCCPETWKPRIVGCHAQKNDPGHPCTPSSLMLNIRTITCAWPSCLPGIILPILGVEENRTSGKKKPSRTHGTNASSMVVEVDSKTRPGTQRGPRCNASRSAEPPPPSLMRCSSIRVKCNPQNSFHELHDCACSLFLASPAHQTGISSFRTRRRRISLGLGLDEMPRLREARDCTASIREIGRNS